MTPTPRDAGIPVLTEVISKEEKEAAARLAAARLQGNPPGAATNGPGSPTRKEDLPELSDSASDGDVLEPSDSSEDGDVPELSESSVDSDVPELSESSEDSDVPELFDSSKDSDVPELSDNTGDNDVPELSDSTGDNDVPELSDSTGDSDVPELSEPMAGEDIARDDGDDHGHGQLTNDALDDEPVEKAGPHDDDLPAGPGSDKVTPLNKVEAGRTSTAASATGDLAQPPSVPFLPLLAPTAEPLVKPAVWSRPGQQKPVEAATAAAATAIKQALPGRSLTDETGGASSLAAASDRPLPPVRPFSNQKPGLPAIPKPSPIPPPPHGTAAERDAPLLWGKPSAAPLGRASPAGQRAPSSLEGLAVHAAVNWDDEDWQQLERRLRERILGQLLGRIDIMLEHRIREVLAPILQASVSTLASDIRSGLHQGMEDLVSRAVAQEISRLHSSKK